MGEAREVGSRYAFLVETYRTEVLKVLGVFCAIDDADLPRRPRDDDRRGRSLLEHMVHQLVGENTWFEKMLGIRVTDAPLPATETRDAFVTTYASHASARLAALRQQDDAWWEERVAFFEVQRSRAWVLTRRIAHTAHHRGQQTAMLRMLGRELHSIYGPTADTGGLPANGGRVIYPYPDLQALLAGRGRGRAPLPGPGEGPVTERP